MQVFFLGEDGCVRAISDLLRGFWVLPSKRLLALGQGCGVGACMEVAVPAFIGRTVAPVEPARVSGETRSADVPESPPSLTALAPVGR